MSFCVMRLEYCRNAEMCGCLESRNTFEHLSTSQKAQCSQLLEDEIGAVKFPHDSACTEASFCPFPSSEVLQT